MSSLEAGLDPVDPAYLRNLREHVHEAIRQAIVAGRLEPERRLNERALAASLGVSTTPVKEALRRLEGEGLVRTEARRGIFVTYGAHQALEMALARSALESVMAHVAARRIGEAAIGHLGELIERMAHATDYSALETLVELNEAFHAAIHRASRCEYLARMIASQRTYAHAQRIQLLGEWPERAKGLAEHRAVFEAIRDRDPELAEVTMRRHIVRSAKAYISYVFGDVDLGAGYGD